VSKINLEKKSQFLLFGFLFFCVFLSNSFPSNSSINDANNLGFHYFKEISIDHQQVTTNLTNFPLLLSINDPDLTICQPTGNDIVFYDKLGENQLDHEIEKFDKTTGELIAWIRIPQLSNSIDTDIRMYYNNSNAIDTENKEGVFVIYSGVYHLHDDFKDSSSNQNTGTNFGSNDVSGKFGDGQLFDGVDDYVTLGDQLEWKTNTGTISAWIQHDGTEDPPPGQHNVVLSGGSTKSNLQYWMVTTVPNDPNSAAYAYGGANRGYWSGINDMQSNSWHHLVWRCNGRTTEFYYDGVNQGSITNDVGTSNGIWFDDWTGINRFDIGMMYQQAYYGYFDGNLDEIRITQTPLNESWVLTEYQNQKSPSTFYSISTKEKSDSSLTIPPLLTPGFEIMTLFTIVIIMVLVRRYRLRG
jgi:hypothetical protein